MRTPIAFDTAFNAPTFQSTSLNSNGQVCFQTTVIGGDVSGTTNNVGWLTGFPGNLDWVARKGDVMVIPAGVPHWFQDVQGPLTYFVVKPISKN